MEFPPHPWIEVTYTGYFFGTGNGDNRHKCTRWDRDSIMRCLSMGTGDKLRFRVLASGPDPWEGSDEDLRIIELTSGRASFLFGAHGEPRGIASMLF